MVLPSRDGTSRCFLCHRCFGCRRHRVSSGYSAGGCRHLPYRREVEWVQLGSWDGESRELLAHFLDLGQILTLHEPRAARRNNAPSAPTLRPKARSAHSRTALAPSPFDYGVLAGSQTCCALESTRRRSSGRFRGHQSSRGAPQIITSLPRLPPGDVGARASRYRDCCCCVVAGCPSCHCPRY